MFDFLKGKKEEDIPADPQTARELCIEAEKLNEEDEPKKAEKLYQKAFSCVYKLYSEEPEKYGFELASCASELGNTQQNLEKYEEAGKMFNIAAEIIDALAVNGDKDLQEAMADIHLSIGDTYFFKDKFDAAETEYLFSLEVYERLEDKFGGYIEDIAYCHDCLAKSFSGRENYTAAIGSYEKIISVYEKLIADSNGASAEDIDPLKDDLAQAYSDIGYAYSCAKDYEDAEKYYLKAAEIFKKLAASDPEEYTDKLVSQYQDLSVLYSDMKKPEISDEYKRLYKNPDI